MSALESLWDEFVSAVEVSPSTDLPLIALVEIETWFRDQLGKVGIDDELDEQSRALLIELAEIRDDLRGLLSKSLTIDLLLEYLGQVATNGAIFLANESIDEYLNRLDIDTKLIDGGLLTPNDPVGDSYRTGEKHVWLVNKLEILISEVLIPNGIYTNKFSIIKSSSLVNNKALDQYLLIELSVSDLLPNGATLLLNPNYKQATFVIDGLPGLDVIKGVSKEDISKKFKSVVIGYTNKEYWKLSLKFAIFGGVNDLSSKYINNPEMVDVDLLAFVEKAGLKSPFDLRTKLDKKITIDCVFGLGINFERYLCFCGIVLGEASTSREARHKKGVILKRLLKIAGYEVLEDFDKAYFDANLRVDLDEYVLEAGVNSYEELLTSYRDVEIICQNGKICKFRTYINICARCYGAKGLSFGEARDFVLTLAGCERISYPKMDDVYFSDLKNNVQVDILAFTRVAGLDDIEALTITHADTLKAVCSNGEECNLRQYLVRAKKYFCPGSRKERHQLAVVLNEIRNQI